MIATSNLYIYDSNDVSLIGCNFYGNSDKKEDVSDIEGNFIKLSENSKILIVDSTFIGGKAQAGGAIYSIGKN